MDWRYWVELPLVVGLAVRFFADVMAGGLWADGRRDSENWDSPDSAEFESFGTRLQSAPSFWHPDFGARAYAFYAVMMLYWAFVFQIGFVDTIANPGPVFGALGVPDVVMRGVAWANAGVLYAAAGVYAADAVSVWGQ